MKCFFFQPVVHNAFQPIELTSCGKEKGCYRNPPSCGIDTCDLLVTWTSHDDYVQFEMSGDSHGWIGVGFSIDKKMVYIILYVLCLYFFNFFIYNLPLWVNLVLCHYGYYVFYLFLGTVGYIICMPFSYSGCAGYSCLLHIFNLHRTVVHIFIPLFSCNYTR